jgi:hypothetical protein
MVSIPINHFHWSFLRVLGLVTLVSFDLIEWNFFFVSMNVVMGRKPLQRPQPHEVNQVRLFGPFFHQEVLHMAKCGGNHFLPWDSYSGQWRSCSWCMWPMVQITDVDICSMCISQVERIYMDPIRVRVHRETNLWQAQRNLVGMSKCKWMDDAGWFPTTPRYCLLGPKAQKGIWCLHTNPTLSIQSWFVFILMMFLIYRM